MKNRKLFGVILALFAIASFARAAYLYAVEGVVTSAVWSILAGVLLIIVLVLGYKKTNSMD